MKATIIDAQTAERVLVARRKPVRSIEVEAASNAGFGTFVPSVELLAKTIDAVFWASVTSEEGRPVFARICFANIDANSCTFAPRPLTAGALRQLSPFFDLSSNSLAVNAQAQIVGVRPWQSRRIGISATRPGKLAILESGHVMAVLDGNEWVIVDGDSGHVEAVVAKCISSSRGGVEWFVQAESLIHIARVARSCQRGAAFVVLGESDRPAIDSISFEVTNFTPLTDLMRAVLASSSASESGLAPDTRMAMKEIAVQTIAGGAGIDGATVIQAPGFQLVGFGAKLHATPHTGDIQLLELPDTMFRQVQVKSLGGMRHQSAASFVAAHPDATIMTVSQDGTISLFTWATSEQQVVVVKHLDRYLEAR